MRLTPRHPRTLPPVWTLVAFGLLLVVPLLLIHAKHIPEQAAHAGHAGHAEHAADATHALMSAVLDGPHEHGSDCPTPEWVLKHGEDAVAHADAVVAPLVTGPDARHDTAPRVERVLPVPRGPDRQALLQRFTL